MSNLNKYFHSRNFTALVFVIVAVLTYIAFSNGQVTEIIGCRGTVFPSPNRWVASPDASLWVNILFMALTAVAFIALNKVYNFMRAPSALAASLYLAMTASVPIVAGQFNGGTLMCLVLLAIVAILFSCYDDRSATRRVFLIFFLLSLASLVQYAFMFYIVIAIPGLAQMRMLNFRSILAMVFGIVCPVWILYAFGVMELTDLRWPKFESTFTHLSVPGMITVLVAVGFTMILGFMAMCGILMKILGYNAKYRAYNGFLTLLMLWTMLLVVVDYSNLSAYLPLLCLLSANQLSHYFSIHNLRGSQWAILSIFILYLIIYAFSFYL